MDSEHVTYLVSTLLKALDTTLQVLHGPKGAHICQIVYKM